MAMGKGGAESLLVDGNHELSDQVLTLDSKLSRIVKVEPGKANELLQELAKVRQSELINYSLWEKVIGVKKGRLIVVVDCSELPKDTLTNIMVSLHQRICQQAIDEAKRLPRSRGAPPEYPRSVATTELQANTALDRKLAILPDILDSIVKEMHLKDITLAITNFDRIKSDKLDKLQVHVLHNLVREICDRPNRNILVFHEQPISYSDGDIGLPSGGGYTVDMDFTNPE